MKDTLSTAEKTAYLTQRALHYLGYRPRSEFELRKYLERKLASDENQEEIVNQTLQNIKQFNVLNDEQFAKDLARSKLAQGIGPIIIRLELKQKGIASNILQEVLASIPEQELLDSLLKQVQKKARLLKTEPGYKRQQQLNKYLYSRGFPLEMINQVIDANGVVRVQ